MVKFEGMNKRALVLLSTFLLTLVITTSVFAYTFTVQSTTIGVTAVTSDFAEVSENGTDFDYAIMGRVRGKIDGGTMFNIVRDSNYTGDLEVNVYLANAPDLTEDYSFWMLMIELQDINGDRVDEANSMRVLSLNTPKATFYCDNFTTGDDRYIEVLSGGYRTFCGTWLTGEDPVIVCQAVQASSY